MRTLLNDLALLHDDDLISILDRREPMGNYNAGLFLCAYQCVQSLLNLVFTFSIKCTCGFIKQDYLWIAYQGPCYGNSLLLPSGELGASLATDCFEAFGKLVFVLNERECVRLAAGFAQPFIDLLLRAS